MPLTHLLGLIALVVMSGGVTILLALSSGTPLTAVAFAALAASLILGWSRLGR